MVRLRSISTSMSALAAHHLAGGAVNEQAERDDLRAVGSGRALAGLGAIVGQRRPEPPVPVRARRSRRQTSSPAARPRPSTPASLRRTRGTRSSLGVQPAPPPADRRGATWPNLSSSYSIKPPTQDQRLVVFPLHHVPRNVDAVCQYVGIGDGAHELRQSSHEFLVPRAGPVRLFKVHHHYGKVYSCATGVTASSACMMSFSRSTEALFCSSSEERSCPAAQWRRLRRSRVEGRI